MCLICRDLDLDKLTIDEAWKNFFEMNDLVGAGPLDLEHYVKVYCKLMDEASKQGGESD